MSSKGSDRRSEGSIQRERLYRKSRFPRRIPIVLRTYWLKELRSLFRDRNILVYGLLLPVFLYPSLLFGITQIQLYTQGLRERVRPTVAIPRQPKLAAFVGKAAGDSVHVVELAGDAAELLGSGSLDLVVTPLHSGKTVRLEYVSGRADSELALERIEPIVRDYGSTVERELGTSLGLDPDSFAPDRVQITDVADPEVQTRFMLATLLPLVLVVMCTFGATYPAIDLTAGERERHSAETTILLPIPRRQVALGKCLAVTTAAFVALLVNLLAMLLSAGPTLAHIHGGASTLPGLAWESLPLVVIYGLLLSFVFSNLFLLAGSYAKNYREAQAYITPLQVVTMLPALLTLMPGAELNPTTAVIPVYNAALAFRASLLGELSTVPVVVSLASLALFSLVCFRATARRLSDTAYVLGFHDPDQLAEAKA